MRHQPLLALLFPNFFDAYFLFCLTVTFRKVYKQNCSKNGMDWFTASVHISLSFFWYSNIKIQFWLQKIFGPIVCRVRVTQLRWRLSAKRLGGHLKKDKIIFQSALDLLFPFLPSIRFSFETLQRTLCNDGDKPSLQLYRTQVIFLWWQNLKWEKM